MKTETIQTKVLRVINSANQPVDISYLKKSLPLRPQQLYESLRHLKRRKLIEKNLVKTENQGFGKSPYKLWVQIRKDKNNYIREKIRRILNN